MKIMRERLNNDNDQKQFSSSSRERLDNVKNKIKKGSLTNSTRYKNALLDQDIDKSDITEFDASGIGRLPVIADERVYETIVESVREGNFISTAASLAGVAYETVITSLEKGQKGENDLYYNFWKDVKQAEAESEYDLVSTVALASKIDWKAAIELLQRRFPDRWAKKDSHTIKHEHSGKVQHTIRNEFATKILENPVLRQQAREFLKQMDNVEDGVIVDG